MKLYLSSYKLGNKKDELKFNVMDKTIDLGSIVKGK